MNLMIVDDEVNIREGMKSLIDWKYLGFDAIEEASDGLMALKKIKVNPPDVCIIDIKMPELDGIQVIEQLFEEGGYKTKFIILSGFAEFEYAKRAMRCHVKHYVLKPIEEDLLIEKVIELREEISKEHEISEMQRARWMAILFQGDITQTLTGEIQRAFDFPWKSYQIILLEINKDVVQDEYVVTHLEQLVQGQLNRPFIFAEHHGMYVLLVRDHCFQKTFVLLENLKEAIIQSLHKEVYISVGRPVYTLDDITKSYDDAHQLMKYRFVYTHGQVMDYGLLNRKKEIFKEMNLLNPWKSYADFIQEVTTAIYLNQMRTINDLMEELLIHIQQNVADSKRIIATYVQLYTRIVVPISDKYPQALVDSMDDTVLQSICEQKDLRKLHGFIKYRIVQLAQNLAASQPKNNMELLCKYIHENYTKEMRIEDLAKQFSYHSGYLGRQFKEKIGKPFNQYVDEVRISESKKLLQSSELKIYEIAQNVGYSDPDYFATKFRKYENMSPNEYRSSWGMKK